MGTRRRGERPLAMSVLLHAALVAASAVAIFPILWVLAISLRPGFAGSSEVRLFEASSLANYGYVLSETKLLVWLWNSVRVAFFTTVIGIFLSATAGYALSRFRFPGHRPLMWTFLITQMFPAAILLVPLYNILNGLGLIDTHTSLVFACATVAVPFCTWMLKGYFDAIPIEIDEAGRVDGLTPIGTFWRLIFPLARPGLAVTAFYTFLQAWGEVCYATAFITSDDKKTLALGLQTFVTQHKQEWGYLAAASILVTLPAGIVFFVAQKHLVAGLTAGGTKG
ncbi:sugar ABC transporter permease [Pendulispora albinea]|uniref:Maltose/maltodextrin transport system permease protein MalG n=1 Tax=Pendulispora albinea TaxID=2741071 RepID=A0ABZ2M7Z1_9BACT